MSFVDGWIGLCSATAPSSATEISAVGYARQPIAFGLMPLAWSGEGAARALTPRAGNSRGFSYPYGIANGWTAPAGRAVWDAPTGGSLLLILPYGAGARTRPVEVCEPGDIVLEGAVFLPTFSGQVAAGAVLGTCYDRADIVGPRSPAPEEAQGPEGTVLMVNRGTVTAGVALVFNRGVLQSSASWATL